MEIPNLVYDLKSVINDCEDCGRQIYYAISLLPLGHPAEENLKLALKYLGIHKPEEVGLSSQSIAQNRK